MVMRRRSARALRTHMFGRPAKTTTRPLVARRRQTERVIRRRWGTDGLARAGFIAAAKLIVPGTPFFLIFRRYSFLNIIFLIFEAGGLTILLLLFNRGTARENFP